MKVFLKVTSIWKLRGDRAVKLANLSLYVFLEITVLRKESILNLIYTSVGYEGCIREVEFPFFLNQKLLEFDRSNNF